MIEFLFDFGPVVIPALVVALTYLGWWKRKKWARISLIMLLVITAGLAAALGLYIYALGQADWSL